MIEQPERPGTPEPGDDAGRCCNALSAAKYRGATAKDRAIYRKWIVGMTALYAALLLLSGLVAQAVDSGAGSTRLTSLSAAPAAVRPGSN